MPKTNHSVDQVKRVLAVSTVLLAVACVLLIVSNLRQLHHHDTTGTNTGARAHVSLGAIQYDLSSGKAVKRSSPELSSLESFLVDRANHDCKATNSSLEPSEYVVKAATDDVSQVLVGYGCGNATADMFAVRNGQEWKFISPTNHFADPYGLPECDYVYKNQISIKIAPVCYTMNGTVMQHTVRLED